jgi:DNA repair protein RecN (Recombination protein N)
MLSRIYIKNFALIDTLEVSLNNGSGNYRRNRSRKIYYFGCITSYPGRKSRCKIHFKSRRKSIVETEFALNNQFKKFLLKMIWIMSCKPSSEEKYCHPVKSRAFINDVPVTWIY